MFGANAIVKLFIRLHFWRSQESLLLLSTIVLNDYWARHVSLGMQVISYSI